MNKQDKRNACRRFNSIFIFSFIAIMMFNFLQPVKEYSERENRYLQTLPEFSVKSLVSGEYMKEMDSYANDQFLARDFLISVKSKIEYLLGKKENNGVYVCKNGYLMEKPQDMDKELIENNIGAIKALNDTGRYNVSVSVVPPAYEIMKEDLPKNVYRETIPRLNEMLRQAFEGTDIKYRDPSEKLRQHKDSYLYYRTDHHLTTHGSYVLYHDLGQLMDYEPLQSEDFQISDVSREFLGTTYSKALTKTTPDVITEYRPAETIGFKVRFPYEGAEADSVYFPAHLNKKDKYSYYLDGNHALTVVEGPAKNGKHLAVFKDSYAHALTPFLANHYESIHLIDLRYFNDDFIRYMSDHSIGDVLFLYSASSFMSDSTIQKVTTYTKSSPALVQGYGKVYSSKPVDSSYFTETAFIGDSLTNGFKMYVDLPGAEFLSGGSMTIKRLETRKAPGGGTIMERIKEGGFKKVYIMLGINEYLVESNKERILKEYSELVDTVKEHNPDAIIYIESILPVAAEIQDGGPIYNNVIRGYNDELLKMAIDKQIYYVDIATGMTDDKGNLIEGASTDGTHLTREYYLQWLECLKRHTVSSEDAKNSANVIVEEENIVSDYDVAGIAKTIYDNVEFKDQLSEINRRILYNSYGLDESMMANAAGYAGGGATAEEITVFEVKDAKDASTVERLAKEYIETKKDNFRSYIPEEMPKLNKPFIYKDDKVVVICIADSYGKLESKIKEAMKK